MHRKQVCLVLAIAVTASAPAFAQFPSLFDPPRPPSEVPGRAPARQQPAPQYQAPPPQYQPPQDPRPEQQATPFQQPSPRGGVQSQPLPPPPGATAAPAPQPPVQQGTFAPPTGPAAPGQPAPSAAIAPGQTPAPATAALQPGDEVVTTLPTVKIPNPTAVFSGLDKITGRITTFEAAIGETVQFGALRVTPRACYTRPPTETQNTDGFLEVDEITLQGETRRIFTGWMFAASPGLHAVEHPIYDVWISDCKGGEGTTVAAKPIEPDPPPAPAPPAHRAPAKKKQ